MDTFFSARNYTYSRQRNDVDHYDYDDDYGASGFSYGSSGTSYGTTSYADDEEEDESDSDEDEEDEDEEHPDRNKEEEAGAAENLSQLKVQES